MKKKNYKLISGSIVFSVIVLFIFIGPLIYKVNPNTTDVMKIEIKPNGKFLLGTDATGRDIQCSAMVEVAPMMAMCLRLMRMRFQKNVPGAY